MTFPFAAWGDNAPLYLLVFVVLAALLVASRVPVLRTLLRLVTWAGLAVLLVTVLGQRERFDPYVASLLQRFRPDTQQVVGKEVRIRMSPDGHFWARARIDGVERRLLVDSGATITALSTTTAAEAGLKPRRELFPVILRTANGSVEAQTATAGEVRFGTIVARDLAVVVSPAFGDTNVLGMNFLSRLQSWRVEDNTLILTPHHPQEPKATAAPA